MNASTFLARTVPHWPVRCRRAVALVCAAALVSGCAIHRQYRTTFEPCNPTASTNCQTSAIEETPDYLLGFVEFDDQGWLWQRTQMASVLDRLALEARTNDLLLLVFVHGWKHNAAFDDDYVRMFRQVLSDLHQLEATNSIAPRRVAGVYVGWRGLSQRVWGLKELTFWERKNTAHEVGRGALTELLVRLEALRNESRRHPAGKGEPTQLVIVGHSFGGAATYSALAPLLVERAVLSAGEQGRERDRSSTTRGFGDLVVLVNPAFEAARYHVLYDLALQQEQVIYGNEPINLAIFTSKSDVATKIFFPLGRCASTLFENYQDREQQRANLTAVGHYDRYLTHDLIATNVALAKKPAPANPVAQTAPRTDPETIQKSSEQIRSLRARLRPSDEEVFSLKPLPFSGAELRLRSPDKAGLPLYVVAVDKKIIPNHNKIDLPQFRAFLSEFLLVFTRDQSKP